MPLPLDRQYLDHQHVKSIANTASYVNSVPRPVLPQPRGCETGGYVGIVVDASNLLGGARDRNGVPAYRSIVREITAGRSWRGVAVVSRPADGRPIDGLLRMFARVGFSLAVWNPVIANGVAKTDADALVVIEAMKLIHDPRVDELCLCAGDSDYRYLSNECRRMGKRFVVAAFRGDCHPIFHRRADKVIDLDDSHTLVAA